MIDIDFVDDALIKWRRAMRRERHIARAHIIVGLGFGVAGRYAWAVVCALLALGWELLARSNRGHIEWLMEQGARIEMEE